MKKLATFVMGWALIAGAAFAADTNTATSVNIVGFNKITCPTNKYVLVSTAFESISGSDLKCQDVFGDQLPMGSSVYAYNAQTHNYDIDNLGFAGWGTTITFKGYMGFWVFVPDNGSGPASYDVTLTGQVPLSLSKTNTVNNGFTMLGFPYTTDVAWTNTALAKGAQLGDTIHVWNPVTQTYSANNLGFSGWGDPALVIKMNQGFWFETSSATFTNIEARPYNP